MERLFFFVIAVALAFGVGCLGRNRKIGFGWAFAISLINVVIGLIVVLCSKKKTPNELEKKNQVEDLGMGMYSDWSNWLYQYHYTWQPKPRAERLGCHRSLFVIQEEYLRKFTSTPQAFYPMESSWVRHDCHQ